MEMAQTGTVSPEEVPVWVRGTSVGATKGQRNNSGLLGVAQELIPSFVHVHVGGGKSDVGHFPPGESYNNTRKHGAWWECSMGGGEPGPAHAQRAEWSRGQGSRT